MPSTDEVRKQAAQIEKRIKSQFSVGRFNGFVDHKGIDQVAFLYARGAQKLVDLTIGNLRTFQREVVRESEASFRASIKHPDTSVTLGGEAYGRGGNRDRKTGRFTFGGSGTFKNVTSFDFQRQRYIVGWPDVERADKRTDGVWRHLEDGLPAALHKLPRGGFFFDRTTGYFVPGKGPADKQGPGFEAKKFLQDGFNKASASRLPKFDDIIQLVIRDF